MMRRLSMLAVAGLAACTPPSPGGPSARLVDEGKADNFYSNVASEFTVEGSLPVAMSANDYADVQKRTELAKRRITVNAVAPGVIQTPMLGGLKPEVLAEYEKQIPVGRVGRPEDVANAVLFLAAEESDYITGQVLPVTGGWY